MRRLGHVCVPFAAPANSAVRNGTVTAMRKRLTFSIRAMLAAVATIAAALGWYVARVRPQQVAVDAVFECGGSVFYASPNGGPAGLEVNGATVVSHAPGSSHFWRDFYDDVLEVDFYDQPVDDAVCRHLARLPKLRRLLLLGNGISDAGIARLASLSELTVLGLDKTEVTDSGLRHLMGLKTLVSLFLDKTKITDDGLPHLYGLSRLEMITLIDTDTTQEGRARLQEALPQCHVIY